MNLIYRGISYPASIAGTEAPEIEQTGTFLGKTYQMKRAQVTQHQPATELTYRGVRYSR